MRHFATLAALAFLFCWALTPAAHADTAGISFTTPGIVMNLGTGFSLGYSFTANTTMTVTALGYFDDGGLTEMHQVGLFSSGGSLLASTMVNGHGQQSGFFNYNAITAITLLAGQSYEVMGTSGMVDGYTFDTTGLSVDPDITLLRDVFASGNTLQFSTRSENIGSVAGGAFFGANFEEDPAVTPEPASWLLLASGLGGVALPWKRVRRIGCAA